MLAVWMGERRTISTKRERFLAAKESFGISTRELEVVSRTSVDPACRSPSTEQGKPVLQRTSMPRETLFRPASQCASAFGVFRSISILPNRRSFQQPFQTSAALHVSASGHCLDCVS